MEEGSLSLSQISYVYPANVSDDVSLLEGIIKRQSMTFRWVKNDKMVIHC